jgi:hypothetical protein
MGCDFLPLHLALDVRFRDSAGAGRSRGGTSKLSAAQIVSQSAARAATVKSFHFVSVEHVPTPANGLSVTFLEGSRHSGSAPRAHQLQGVSLTLELIVVGTKHFLWTRDASTASNAST